MWGLAWGALVFGELANADASHRLLVVIGSLVMICGALAVTTAVATEKENSSMRESLVRECARYDLDYDRVVRIYGGEAPTTTPEGRAWWDYVILAAAVGVFVWLGVNAQVPALAMNFSWVWVLTGLLLASAAAGSWLLWKSTNFL
jgi:hypothetical protein